MIAPSLTQATPFWWLVVTCAAFVIGLNKGGLAGVSILPVLIFAFVFQARQSTGFVLPLLVVGDICAILIYRKVVVWKVFWKLLPPALAGVVLGYLLMGQISDAAFGPLIGWIILALIVLQFLRSTLGEKLDRFFESHGFSLAMGVLAGVTTMIANAAGPVANLYFLSVRLPKWNLIGTSAWLFWVINLSKVPLSAHLGLTNIESVQLAAILSPLVVAGFFCGRYIAGIVSQKIFERFVLLFSMIGAVWLIR